MKSEQYTALMHAGYPMVPSSKEGSEQSGENQVFDAYLEGEWVSPEQAEEKEPQPAPRRRHSIRRGLAAYLGAGFMLATLMTACGAPVELDTYGTIHMGVCSQVGSYVDAEVGLEVNGRAAERLVWDRDSSCKIKAPRTRVEHGDSLTFTVSVYGFPYRVVYAGGEYMHKAEPNSLGYEDVTISLDHATKTATVQPW